MMTLSRWLSAVADWLSGLSIDTQATLAFLAFLVGVLGVLGPWWMLLIGGGLTFSLLAVGRIMGWF